MQNSEIIAIIPARSGSKGVPGKNIRFLGGYPLIAYAIAAAKLSKSIKRAIVSTDSEKIAEIARKFGAETPFLRPGSISQDNSTDLELFQHAIAWFKDCDGGIPDFMVHLRPTTPLREPAEIERAISLIIEQPDSTALRSAHELAESPHKVFQLDSEGIFKGFFPDDPRPEYYNLPRQSFPKAYYPNGYIDIVRPEIIERDNVLHGKRILGFITAPATEVDRIDDLEYLQYQLEKSDNTVYKYLSEHFPKEA